MAEQTRTGSGAPVPPEVALACRMCGLDPGDVIEWRSVPDPTRHLYHVRLRPKVDTIEFTITKGQLEVEPRG